MKKEVAVRPPGFMKSLLTATRPPPRGDVATMVIFTDRSDAGRRLGLQLEYLRGQEVVVLGLPRGGVPVAFEVAKVLQAPLDIIAVRKLGVPAQPELAMGAIAEHGTYALDQRVIAATHVSEKQIQEVEKRERVTLDDQVARFHSGRARIVLSGKTVVIVDDGIATGSTARAACMAARKLGAAKVVVGAPVASPDAVAALQDEADEVVSLSTPRRLRAIGYHYDDFSPTSDHEVLRLLDAAAKDISERGPAVGETRFDADVVVDASGVPLEGHLYIPERCTAVVVFAHGSGSGRHSPRNRLVASTLQAAGLGTLLLDLLSSDEELDRANVFNIELLADRLTGATTWLGGRPDTASCRVGYFGASTGAGAALWAAAGKEAEVGAVVSRGGRPDLAAERLSAVRAPTLLIVGSADRQVLELNRGAQARLDCIVRLEIVQGATHLFEEPGTLEEAADLARDWFVRYLLPR